MKIFEIKHSDNEKEWIAARTIIGAIHQYCLLNDCSIEDITESEIKELPTKEWNTYIVEQECPDGFDPEDELPAICTFKAWVRQHPEGGMIIGVVGK